MAKEIKKAQSNQKPADYTDTFQQLLHNPELMFQVFDLFPFPIEVFAADGTSVFVNKTGNHMFGVPDAGFIVGKYNVLKDPVMEQMGVSDGLQRAFHGEYIVIYDVALPIQDLVDRGLVAEKPFEKSFADWHFYPVRNGKKLVFVVFVINVKKLYHGRPDLARAKEYLDSHWQGKYDAGIVASAVGMSKSQLYALFKEHVKMTPGEYHKLCKIEHIKEQLRDKNLSIKQAFAACGESSRGWLSKVFKDTTGQSPGEFRKKYREVLP